MSQPDLTECCCLPGDPESHRKTCPLYQRLQRLSAKVDRRDVAQKYMHALADEVRIPPHKKDQIYELLLDLVDEAVEAHSQYG